jgi:hypothetical protein
MATAAAHGSPAGGLDLDSQQASNQNGVTDDLTNKRARPDGDAATGSDLPANPNELSPQQLFAMIAGLGQAVSGLGSEVAKLTTVVADLTGALPNLQNAGPGQAPPTATSEHATLTLAPAPSLKSLQELRFTPETTSLLTKAVSAQVNKVRQLNKAKDQTLSLTKALADSDPENWNVPLPPEVPTHIRRKKATVLHGAGGISQDVLITQQNKLYENHRKSQLLEVQMEKERCEVLQVELEKEMRAERDALQTALSELYVDTIVETEIKELQIRCALEEYDLKIKAVTAQEETKRKADQKKKKEKQVALEKKKLEQLQSSEATSLSALVDNSVAAQLAARDAESAEDAIMDGTPENDASELLRLQDKRDNDRSVMRNMTKLVSPPKKQQQQQQRQQPKKQQQQQGTSSKNGSAGLGGPPQAGEKKKKKRGARGKGAAHHK